MASFGVPPEHFSSLALTVAEIIRKWRVEKRYRHILQEAVLNLLNRLARGWQDVAAAAAPAAVFVVVIDSMYSMQEVMRNHLVE